MKPEFLPVCQRSDNKTVSASQEFILVNKIHIRNRHYSLVQVFLKIKSTLFQPFKISNWFDVHFYLKTWNTMRLHTELQQHKTPAHGQFVFTHSRTDSYLFNRDLLSLTLCWVNKDRQWFLPSGADPPKKTKDKQINNCNKIWEEIWDSWKYVARGLNVV